VACHVDIFTQVFYLLIQLVRAATYGRGDFSQLRTSLMASVPTKIQNKKDDSCRLTNTNVCNFYY